MEATQYATRSREGFVGVLVTRVAGVGAHQLADSYLGEDRVAR